MRELKAINNKDEDMTGNNVIANLTEEIPY